jgi:hypothetical protein
VASVQFVDCGEAPRRFCDVRPGSTVVASERRIDPPTLCVCVCVSVCVREREREEWGGGRRREECVCVLLLNKENKQTNKKEKKNNRPTYQTNRQKQRGIPMKQTGSHLRCCLRHGMHGQRPCGVARMAGR